MNNIERDTVGLDEAATIMKVHINTVMKLISAGVIPAAKVGRAWVMLRRDVLNYVEQQIRAQTSQRLGMTLPATTKRKRGLILAALGNA